MKRKELIELELVNHGNRFEYLVGGKIVESGFEYKIGCPTTFKHKIVVEVERGEPRYKTNDVYLINGCHYTEVIDTKMTIGHINRIKARFFKTGVGEGYKHDAEMYCKELNEEEFLD